MNLTDYYQLIAEYQGVISGIWEVWLASTFAFIVAFHAGRVSLTKFLTTIGCSLYVATSIVIIARYVFIALNISRLTLRMEESGIAPLSSGSPVEAFTGSAIVVLSVGTMLCGSLIAVYFAIRQYRATNDT